MALLCVTAALAGEMWGADGKIARADLVVEVQYTVKGEIPPKWPNKTYDPLGWGFPDHLSDAAKRDAVVTRTLVGQGPPPSLEPYLTSSSACWWKARERGSIRILLFFANGAPLLGVEMDRGGWTDLNPEYEALVTAVDAALDARAQPLPPVVRAADGGEFCKAR
ncbi:MAG: hypothetical protein ACOZNI_27460 [Myxococcota bacterium]